MPTTRRPINRPPRSRITPRAIESFRQMQNCDNDDERAALQSALHDELQLMPHQWPVVVDPDEGESVYPSDTGGAAWHTQAQALWRELERRAV